MRVTTTASGCRSTKPWAGYHWSELVRAGGCTTPERHHADAGLDNQLAFLDAALDYVADHTPRDTETRYLEAVVTTGTTPMPRGRSSYAARTRGTAR